MAPNSSTLVWKIPWTEEPGGLQSMGSLRVGHDWATSFSLFTFTHWRRKWQPTPVFLPGESQGRGSLVGFRLWGRTVRHDWSDLAAAAAAFVYFLLAGPAFYCCTAFPGCSEQGLLSSWGGWASRRGGVSCRRVQASVVSSRGLSICGSGL